VKRAAFAVTAALWLSVLGSAGAEPASAADSSGVARVVEIRVSGDAAALARVRLTASELLLRLDVQPNVKAIEDPETPPTEPTPLVIAYVDLRNSSSPSIDIEDGKTRQELTRRNLSDVSSLETGVEALLHVLYLAVESTLQVGVTRAAAPAPAPEKKPAPPAAKAAPRSRFGFDIGPLLRLSSLGSSRVVPGGGAVLEPRADLGNAQLGLHLSAAFHGSSQLAFAQGEAAVRPLQFRLVPTADWLLTPDISGCVGLGVGLDSLMVEPVQAPERGSVAAGQSTVDPVLTALVGARVPISGRAFLAALASLDFDAAPTSFVVHEGPATSPILKLPRLRGGFTLALSFTAAGERRFAKAGAEQ